MRQETTSHVHGIPPILTKTELAELLRVHPRTIERLVHAGDVPQGRRIGRQLRWLREDVLAALGVECNPVAMDRKTGNRKQMRTP